MFEAAASEALKSIKRYQLFPTFGFGIIVGKLLYGHPNMSNALLGCHKFTNDVSSSYGRINMICK